MNDSPPTTEAPREQAIHERQLREDAPLDEEGSWLEQAEELPPRPRRRILAPVPVALLVALAIACGFIAGVLVQKGQGGSSGSGNGFPSLRGASGLGGSGSSAGLGSRARSSAVGASSSASTSGSGSSPFGGANPGAGAGAGSATIGQVAYVSKGVLYVTTTEGNTVKVTAAAGSKLTKTVKTPVKGIHPGETVLVSGTTNANGSITASSIRAGDSGGFGGAALFGGGAGARGGALSAGGSGAGAGSSGAGAGGAGAGGGSSSSTGGPALFGKE